MTEALLHIPRGAIVYDAEIFPQASASLFKKSAWQSVTPVAGPLRSAGRGNTLIVSDGEREFVWRRFVRGGLIGKVIKDSYFWTGEDQTRGFSEWHLLRKLHDMGLNVPIPAAARYRRTAMFYTADLLTVRVPGIRSLAERLTEQGVPPDFWDSLGRAIAQVHEVGVYHADMNAYNVQIDADDEMWLLDFDKGQLSPNGTWKQETLSRLHRSLNKVSALSAQLRFSQADWEAFLSGYFSESRSE